MSERVEINRQTVEMALMTINEFREQLSRMQVPVAEAAPVVQLEANLLVCVSDLQAALGVEPGL